MQKLVDKDVPENPLRRFRTVQERVQEDCCALVLRLSPDTGKMTDFHEKPVRRLGQCGKDIARRSHEEFIEISGGEGQVRPLSPEAIKLTFRYVSTGMRHLKA